MDIRRKVREDESTNDLFAFMTTDPNAEVKAAPQSDAGDLTTPEDVDIWMTAPAPEALLLQRPLSDGPLTIVARGVKKDGAAAL